MKSSNDLKIGKKYTFSTDPTELVYIGECDISDQYHFGTLGEPEVVHLTIEESDVELVKPIKSCEHCGSNLNLENSAVRAFYKENTDVEVFLKGRYLQNGKGDVPDGTFHIDEDIDYDIDSEIHEDSDRCGNCNGENE